MSKMLKKVFKKAKKVVKKVTKFVKKYWKEIVLVAAVVFTAGAALGYVGVGAQGGLTFGAGMGVGGMTGVTSAYGALGSTVAGAMGFETTASGAMTAKSAAVQGLGTGGMATSSAGVAANVGGSTLAAQTANAAALTNAGAIPVAGAQTLPAVQAAGIPQAAAAGSQMSGVGAASMSSVAPAAAVPGVVAPTVTPLATSLAPGSAALTAGETMQLGSVGLTGYSQYAQGADVDAAEQEAEDRQAARWDWNYGNPEAYAGDAVPMSQIGYQPSQGLLQRQQEGAYDYQPASQPSTLDDIAAARYA